MKYFILIALALVGMAYSQLPTPNRQVGYTMGNPAAPVVLEMFGDLQCIYCGGSYPTNHIVSQVLNHFGGDQVYFILHIFPLWLHRQAGDAAKALAAINQNAPEQTFKAVAYFFQNQAQFDNNNFVNQTEQDLIDLFTKYASNFGVDQTTFLNSYANASVQSYVTYDVHLGVSRGVASTPTFFVNGFVNTTLGNSTTYDDWVSYLGALITNN